MIWAPVVRLILRILAAFLVSRGIIEDESMFSFIDAPEFDMAFGVLIGAGTEGAFYWHRWWRGRQAYRGQGPYLPEGWAKPEAAATVVAAEPVEAAPRIEDEK